MSHINGVNIIKDENLHSPFLKVSKDLYNPKHEHVILDESLPAATIKCSILTFEALKIRYSKKEKGLILWTLIF